MNRREFCVMAAAIALPKTRSPQRLSLPVRVVTDRLTKWRPERLHYFWATIWPEAVRDFGRCGIRIEANSAEGEVQRNPGAQPYLVGLEPRVLNLVLTGRIPVEWDQGLGLSGVTTRYRGCHMCMLGLVRAHAHQIPFLSTNTCVHEMLHAVLGDIFENRPGGLSGDLRELRVDCYATRLWLFHEGAAIRESAESYLARLRAEGRH